MISGTTGIPNGGVFIVLAGGGVTIFELGVVGTVDADAVCDLVNGDFIAFMFKEWMSYREVCCFGVSAPEVLLFDCKVDKGCSCLLTVVPSSSTVFVVDPVYFTYEDGVLVTI